jgi:hypothetical protein
MKQPGFITLEIGIIVYRWRGPRVPSERSNNAEAHLEVFVRSFSLVEKATTIHAALSF